MSAAAAAGVVAAARIPAATGVPAAPAAAAGGTAALPPPPAPAAALRRHQLLQLSAGGWSRVSASCWPGGAARDCIAHWAAHDLPLVVARQRAPWHAGVLDLGLPAPARWARQRIDIRVDLADVRWSAVAFPPAPAIAPLLPPAARAEWLALADALDALGVAARVYGSFGWQSLTGLGCVRDGCSDVDLLLPVADAAVADAVAARLLLAEHAAGPALPRLDGEFEWPDGRAVAWREWPRWRAGGGAGTVLVKRIDGAALVSGRDWLAAAPRVERPTRPATCVP